MMKKWVSRLIDGILGAFIVLLLYCQVSMMITSNRDYGVPSVFGISMLYVATDSMEGTNPDSLNTGTGAILKKVPAKDIVVGDVITFYYPALQAPDTHRVLEIVENADGTRVFKTRGDNLHAWSCPVSGCPETPWEIVEEKYYVGKIVAHNDAFGKFLTILSPQAAGSAGKTAWFFPVAVMVPIVAFATISVVKSLKKYKAESKAEKEELKAAMEAAGIDQNDEAQVMLFEEKFYLKKDIREEMERTKAEEKKRIQKEMAKEAKKAKKGESK